MSHQGENYFSTSDRATLEFISNVIERALENGQKVNFYTHGTTLKIKRGAGVWSPPLRSTPDPERDTALGIWKHP